MLLEVSTTYARRTAATVPSSGIVTWKSDSTSSSSASNSKSTLSISTRSTVGSSDEIASSSGRVSRKSWPKMSSCVASHPAPLSAWMLQQLVPANPPVHSSSVAAH